MIKKAPFGGAKALLGCGIIFILFSGILGIVLSFFAEDPGLASLIRKRCVAGILVCIIIIVLVKVIKSEDVF